ncbi:MAG: AAA family ATPase [Alphaproteobacteria bacterium]|nr:AAA family ATPase [Alphaproteobacteria bacterium]
MSEAAAKPNDPTTDKVVDPAETIAQIRQIMADHPALTLDGIGGKIGYNGSTISSVLNGKYAARSEPIIEALSIWIGQFRSRKHIEALVGNRQEWIACPTASRVYHFLSGLHTLAFMGLVYGAPGMCKSHTAEKYRADSKHNVWIVTARPDCASRSAFLREIASVLFAEDQPRGTDREITKRIINFLQGTDGLLIVDEAQELGHASIQQVRHIHDASKTAVCCTGNDLVYQTTHGDGVSQRFSTLIRRFKLKLRLDKPTYSDITTIAGHFGITGEDELRALEEIAAGPGRLDHTIHAIRTAHIIGKGQPVTASRLRAIGDEWAVRGTVTP